MDEVRTTPGELPAEGRAPDLRLQFEQVSIALQQLRQTHGSLHEMESRLAELTRECETILDRWARNDEKHASAVLELHSRLGEWNDLERKLLGESAARVHQFERSLQHEWQALKQKHEQPLQQLEAQATRIGETCLSAVDHALRGLDRAEARLAALEQELYREMGDLSREVREAVAEMRHGVPVLAARQPWALDSVIRLHNELRAEADDRGVLQAAPAGDTVPPVRLASDPTAPDAAVPAAHATPPPAPDTGAATAPEVAHHDAVVPATAHMPPTSEPRGEAAPTPESVVAATAADAGGWARALRRPPVVAAAVLVLALAGYALFLRAQVRAGLRDAAARAEAAERGATATRQEAQEQIAAAQRAAEAQLASLQDATASAQLLTAVAAAPDLVRMALVPRGGAGPGVQVLWSRTQGAAVSSARLAAPPHGRVYQLWLLTRSGPVAVGVFAPTNGRASAVFESPAGLPRPVIGAAITLEEAGGSRQPSGAYLYSTVPAAPSAS
jgi:hypothetical protein